MNLKKGNKLYVRIDYKLGEKDATLKDIQNHLAYAKKIASERCFMGGGFSDTKALGGMCLFEAESFEEAQNFAQNDPIIISGLYRYEIYEWNLVVLSEDIVAL